MTQRSALRYAAASLLIWSLCEAPLFAAPSLSGGSASGQTGTTVNLPITFDPTTASVAGIQFSLTLPTGISTVSVTAGSIVTAAGKSISTNFNGSVWNFIVFGVNQTGIASGSLLTAQLRIAAGATLGAKSIAISNVVYVDPNGQSVTAGTTTGGTVTVVAPAPVITSAGTATGTSGVAFSYQITATNSPTSYSASGLPANLTINTTTGLISGTPSAAGPSTITLNAVNAGGTGTKTLTLTVNAQAPVVTSAGTATATNGVAFSYQITATNSPTSFGAAGLAPGLAINTTTGLISGTPTQVGVSTVTLSAVNSGGTGTKSLGLTVNPQAPVVTSAATAVGTTGVAFSYQIAATNSPTSYSATGLPAGLSLNTATGLITGTPTAAGSFNLSVTATNAGGSGNRAVVLTVFSACDINTNTTTDVTDIQLSANQAIAAIPCSGDINRDGICNVIDVQRVVNAVLGGQCVTP